MSIDKVIQLIKADDILKVKSFDYLCETYFYISQGTTRYVFANSTFDKVIKFPINFDSQYNQKEFSVFTNATCDQKLEMADTKLVYNNLLIEQEYCKPIGKLQLTLKQIQFINSCRQNVGINKAGKLVCYDLEEYRKY